MKKEKINDEEIAKVEKTKFPRGMGSMYVNKDHTYIIFKKSLDGKQIVVKDVTVKRVLEKMRQKEKEVESYNKKQEKTILSDALMEWIFLEKKKTIKASTRERNEITVRNQITPYSIGKQRYMEITPNDIRHYLEELVEKEYSWSTIKKAYDLLKSFYRTASYEYEFKDPMRMINMVDKKSVKKAEKEIEILDDAQIKAFVNEATKMTKTTRREVPFYRYGYVFVALIYTGMRIGELMALQWKDIDFDNNIISITKSVENVKNYKYEGMSEEERVKKGITKRENLVGTTKTERNRIIHMNKQAADALKKVKEYTNYNQPEDLVASTRNGTYNTATNMYKALAIIEEAAGIEISPGLHVLRHTCASLYFRKGVRIELIADLLGNSVEVCRTRYVTLLEEQKKKAVALISDFDVDFDSETQAYKES